MLAALFLSLLLTLLLLLVALLLSIATRGAFVHRATQRVEIVGELARAIQIRLGSRTIWTTRTLLSRLQLFGKVVETALDRALFGATTVLLPAIQRLLAFANAIRNPIACK